MARIEDVMSQAAYSQISEVMPSLREYLLGFSMVDSDEKENRGIGVLLAKVGDTYIYIPSIYRHGQICDMDLLYEPENNRFLPAQDNTLSYLLSKKTDTTAEAVEKPQMSRGGTNGGAGSVSLNLPFTMFTKVASGEITDTPSILKIAAADIAQVLLSYSGSFENLYQSINDISAPKLGKLASATMSEALLNKLDTPAGYNAFAQWYSKEDIDKLVDTLIDNVVIDRVGVKGKGPNPPAEPVKVLTSASVEARDLSDEEKASIIRDGAVIVDNRGLVPSEVFKLKQNSDYQTPSQNGLYELLKLDGTTVTAYVVDMNGAEGFDKFTTTHEAYGIIPVDDGAPRRMHRIDFAPLGQFYPMDMSIPLGGTDIGSLTRDTFRNGEIVIVTPKGEALALRSDGMYDDGHWLHTDEDKFVGFRAHPVMLEAADGLGKFPCDADDARTWVKVDIETKLSPMPDVSAKREHITQIIVGRPGSVMQIRGNSLRVPEGSKVYDVPSSYEANNDLDLVDQSNAVEAIAERDKLIKVTIYSADGLVTLSDKMMKKASGSIIDVAKQLVIDYAVAPKDAVRLVKEASAKQGGDSYLIKVANSSGFDMAFAQEEPSKIDYTETTVLEPKQSAKDIDDQSLINNAMNAGVRQVLDVDMLKLLAEDDSSAREIRTYIPKLVGAVDALGRLLFLTRVNDSMQESYGEQRTLVMEKSIKSAFVKLWDIVLGLQQGQIDNLSDLVGGDLAQSIG